MSRKQWSSLFVPASSLKSLTTGTKTGTKEVPADACIPLGLPDAATMIEASNPVMVEGFPGASILTLVKGTKTGTDWPCDPLAETPGAKVMGEVLTAIPVVGLPEASVMALVNDTVTGIGWLLDTLAEFPAWLGLTLLEVVDPIEDGWLLWLFVALPEFPKPIVDEDKDLLDG